MTEKELEDAKKARKGQTDPTAIQIVDPQDEAKSPSKRIYDRAHERYSEATQLQGKAANRFCSVLKLENVPLFLFLLAGRTCLELRRHREQVLELIEALKLMKQKFPNSMEYSAQLAFEYLKRRQFSKAVVELTHVVERWPQKAQKEEFLLSLALKWSKKSTAHLFDKAKLKSSSYAEIAKVAKELVEIYQKSGHNIEANFVSDEALAMGLFTSKWQRLVIDNNLFLSGRWKDYNQD